MPREEILRDFRRDGIAVVEGLLAPSAVARLLDDIRDVLRRQMIRHRIPGAASEGRNFDSALTGLFRDSMDSYLAAARLSQYLPSLHRLGTDDTILDLVRALGVATPVISTRPVVHIISEDLKVPGGYHRTPPHQDWRSVQGSLDALVVWVPLVPVVAGSNALEVIPGSHRRGLLPSVPHVFGTAVEPGQISAADFRPVAAVPGDVVVFSMFLVHRTGAAADGDLRWAASFRYNNLDEPSFIERDFPNPYIYRPRDDLLFDDVPTPADLKSVFPDD